MSVVLEKPSVAAAFRLEPTVPIEQLEISELNPRLHRDEPVIDQIAELMREYGFDPAYAVKAHEEDGRLKVFAGGNRLLAARKAGLASVPVYVYEHLTRNNIWRLAYRDNEQAGQHQRVNAVDVWHDYARRVEVDGWTQAEIAECLGISQQMVSVRIRLSQATALHKPVLVGQLEEAHAQEILAVYQSTSNFNHWLSTEQLHREIISELLGKQSGASVGIKPSSKTVRETAKRWKALIDAAANAWQSLVEPVWQEKFIAALVRDRARTEAAVNRALNEVIAAKHRHQETESSRLRAQADERDREAERLRGEQQRLSFLTSQTNKLVHGDARDVIAQAPAGFHLLLTDPPYGIDFQSNRRIASPKRERIANDGKDEAFSLLADVLAKAFPLMADNATCLIFTGWRYEPEFRQIVTDAGFAIKGSLVWVKQNHGAGDLEGSFAPQHERILHAAKGKPKLQRREADVLFAAADRHAEHPTVKPRELLRKLIEATTAPGDIVVDPFFGSGHTLLEAYSLGRDYFGVELEERWHRLAVDAVHRAAEEDFSTSTSQCL